MIFVHSPEQREAAQAAFEACQKENGGRKPSTAIRDASETPFYVGEFYHQHYYLLRYPEVVEQLLALEGLAKLGSVSCDDFADSPLITKMNGFIGNGSKSDFDAAVAEFGIDKHPELEATLRTITRK